MTSLEMIATGGCLSTFALLFLLMIHNFRMQDLRRRIESLETRHDDHVAWRHAAQQASKAGADG